MPVAPEFQDPDKVANLPPFFGSKPMPEPFFQREVPAPQTFTVYVEDPNPNDRLYVRWVSNYPPYEEAYTKLLSDPPKDGGISPGTMSKYGPVPADCSNFTTGSPNPHSLVVIVADRPFSLPDQAPDSLFRYNSVTESGKSAMQGWTVRCQ